MYSKVRIGAAVTALLGLTGLVPASAQLLSDPEAIRACLCDERQMMTLSEEMHQQQRLYEERRQALQKLDEEVRARRASIDVYNDAEIDAFKRLLNQRDQAADEFAGAVTQSYAQAVNRYNQSVAVYNNNCAGKSYDPTRLAEVRQNLFCPKP